MSPFSDTRKARTLSRWIIRKLGRLEVDGSPYHYHTGEVQIKPSHDLTWTEVCCDGNLHPNIALADEKHAVLHRQDFPHIEDTMIVEITVYLVFFLDDLRDGIDEKNGVARATISAFRENSGRRRSLLFPGNETRPYKHGTPVRRFREEPTPETRIINPVRPLASRNLPEVQITCNL